MGVGCVPLFIHGLGADGQLTDEGGGQGDVGIGFAFDRVVLTPAPALLDERLDVQHILFRRLSLCLNCRSQLLRGNLPQQRRRALHDKQCGMQRVVLETRDHHVTQERRRQDVAQLRPHLGARAERQAQENLLSIRVYAPQDRLVVELTEEPGVGIHRCAEAPVPSSQSLSPCPCQPPGRFGCTRCTVSGIRIGAAPGREARSRSTRNRTAASHTAAACPVSRHTLPLPHREVARRGGSTSCGRRRACARWATEESGHAVATSDCLAPRPTPSLPPTPPLIHHPGVVRSLPTA